MMINKNSNKKNSKIRFSLNFMQANILIFVLIFANIGGWLIASSKASPVNSIDFVYFCPRGTVCGQEGVNILDSSSSVVKSYLKFKTGVTYTKWYVYTIQGYHDTNFYGNYSANPNYTWFNITGELKTRGLVSNNNKVVVLTSSNVMSRCGVAQIGGPVAIVNIFANGYCHPNVDAVVAHEIGHALGLGHINDGKLMDSTACRSYSGSGIYNCPINSSSVNSFIYSPWMNSTQK